MSREDQLRAADHEGDEPSKGSPGDEEGGKPMTFWEHLDELRKRLIWSALAFFVGCLGVWQVHERVFAFLSDPWTKAWHANHLAGDGSLHFGAPAAAFTSYLKLSMLGGAVAAAPFIFYQLWSFIAPGLYAREKRYIVPFVFLSTALFIGGGWFGFKVAFPISYGYFLSLAGTVAPGAVTVTPTVMMNEYVDFCAQTLLAFGIVFEIPMLALFLSVTGIINYLTLIRYGRWFVLAAFIISAIITPPDMASMITMAIPMCALYAVSIGLAYVFGKAPTEEQRAAYRKGKNKDADKGKAKAR